MLEVREYIDGRGRNPFRRWVSGLDTVAIRRIRTSTLRLSEGNLSNVRGVGQGVLEYRINYGPGYRIYFGRDGDALIILLGGGTKSRQHRDIENAQALWQEYRRLK